MEWLNYHHLLYFWTVAKEGSIVKASAVLRLAPPTISGQIKSFEEGLGKQLFSHEGRRLVLTDDGRLAFRYAEEIFSLGREMQGVLKGRLPGHPPHLAIGLTDSFPRLIAARLLLPTIGRLALPAFACRVDTRERLLAALLAEEVDLILSDSPLEVSAKERVYSHLLGESAIGLFATEALAALYQADFPRSLDAAPLILPSRNSALRAMLAEWFAVQGLKPQVVGELTDCAMMQAFGSAGMGLFPAPFVNAAELRRRCRVRLVGRLDDVRLRFYAISPTTKRAHPALAALSETAVKRIFRSAKT